MLDCRSNDGKKKERKTERKKEERKKDRKKEERMTERKKKERNLFLVQSWQPLNNTMSHRKAGFSCKPCLLGQEPHLEGKDTFPSILLAIQGSKIWWLFIGLHAAHICRYREKIRS